MILNSTKIIKCSVWFFFTRFMSFSNDLTNFLERNIFYNNSYNHWYSCAPSHTFMPGSIKRSHYSSALCTEVIFAHFQMMVLIWELDSIGSQVTKVFLRKLRKKWTISFYVIIRVMSNFWSLHIWLGRCIEAGMSFLSAHPFVRPNKGPF